MNWPVLRDWKWLVLQATAILFAIVAIGLAVADLRGWVIAAVLSIIMNTFGVARASHLSGF
ncbi:hypothetical protein ACFSFY_09140 [Sporosarcina siberiensis]|uniref:Uncharacterized protein n=1 Tax=Sporosarcina siberiensis TaxID=1365606 RepID=A0ABW4SFD7_9BACL